VLPKVMVLVVGLVLLPKSDGLAGGLVRFTDGGRVD
jgi:hypothetical protein